MTYHTFVSLTLESEQSDEAVPTKSRSLAAQVARKMLFWASLNTLILTAIGYYYVSERAEQRTLAYLNGYMTQRVRSESQVFKAGHENLIKFRDRFIALYRDPTVLTNPHFETYFENSPDGTIRLRERYYRGTVDAMGLAREGTTGLLGRRRPPLTNELKRRLVLAYQLISEFGPAWNGQLVNLYATFPENGVIIYWPGTPWGRERADVYFPDSEVVAPTLQSNNPQRKPVWTGLYRDPVAHKWNVSYQLPVDLNGRHLLTPGHDILLDDLMSRLINEHPAGAYNLILARNGNLIAHPDRSNEFNNPDSHLNVTTLNDPELGEIYRAITQEVQRNKGKRSTVRIVENPKLDAYVSFAEITGPGWWFITIYPRSLVLESARETANWLLALGALSFILLTLVVVGVLRERVARPIKQMKRASEYVSAGDYLAVADGIVSLPEDQDNEIGLLARSFKSMACSIALVRSRSKPRRL